MSTLKEEFDKALEGAEEVGFKPAATGNKPGSRWDETTYRKGGYLFGVNTKPGTNEVVQVRVMDGNLDVPISRSSHINFEDGERAETSITRRRADGLLRTRHSIGERGENLTRALLKRAANQS